MKQYHAITFLSYDKTKDRSQNNACHGRIIIALRHQHRAGWLSSAMDCASFTHDCTSLDKKAASSTNFVTLCLLWRTIGTNGLILFCLPTYLDSGCENLSFLPRVMIRRCDPIVANFDCSCSNSNTLIGCGPGQRLLVNAKCTSAAVAGCCTLNIWRNNLQNIK